MSSMMEGLKAKSDQLNFIDLGEDGERIIKVEHVDYDPSRPQQKTWVYYEGCNNRPYKPSLGMSRLLAGAWGDEQEGRDWVGKSMQLYGDGRVTFGKGEVGGIRIKALTDIPVSGYTGYIQKNKQVRVKQTIPLLVIEPPQPTENDLQWVKAGKADIKNLDRLTDAKYRAYIESLINAG